MSIPRIPNDICNSLHRVDAQLQAGKLLEVREQELECDCAAHEIARLHTETSTLRSLPTHVGWDGTGREVRKGTVKDSHPPDSRLGLAGTHG